VDIKEKIKQMPDTPGVYLMKDKAGKVIYIGKAKSLKKRLSFYLARDLSTKTVALMSNVYDIKYRVCQNEGLAMLLEAGLIHKYKPKYNVSLRDDKSFPFVKVTNEEFPAIYITRKKEKDRAFYFGPYPNVKLLKRALKIIRRWFSYRSCKKLAKKPCIYYRISLCLAPCMEKINKEQYAKIIENICLILKGRTKELIKKLFQEMEIKSKEQEFEEAAKIRDQINALSLLTQSQTVVGSVDELGDLRNLLKLDRLPSRIEAFDISNITGKQACGAMVSFFGGVPDKNNYRRFGIKTVSTIDDYKMLSEVIHRRYTRVIEEKLPLPNLILIDGGRSHLLTAERELKSLGLKISLVGIAKEKENIYIKDKSVPIKLNSDTPALNLMRRIRDEAHRFAIKYHHVLRRKKIIGR